jgi:hypothetical protein
VSANAPQADIADGPSAHGTLPEPDLTPPDDLADGVQLDAPDVVVDAQVPEADQTVAGAREDGTPAIDLVDAGPLDDATVVEDDVAADTEEEEVRTAAVAGAKM